MPSWTKVDFRYPPYGAGSETFVQAATGFSASQLRKTALATNSERQSHFEQLLRRIATARGDAVVPVFISFRGERRRMDKGCVGHALSRGFIERPADGPDGTLSSVTIRRADAADTGE